MAQVVKSLPANAGDVRNMGTIPGLGRSPGEGNSNSLHDSCLKNFMNRGAWWATVHKVTELDMTEHIAQHILNLNLIVLWLDIY